MLEHCSRMYKALSTAPRIWREWEAERKESQPLGDSLGLLIPLWEGVGWGNRQRQGLDGQNALTYRVSGTKEPNGRKGKP